MKTLTAFAVFAASATAQIIESSSFGYGKTYGATKVTNTGVNFVANFVTIGSPQAETQFLVGRSAAKAMSLLWLVNSRLW
ncbi:hypothetical protein N7470_003525 [Penicillium chermesinum]|nr:hypothetical protein N7470_003525 [Penicillium chermesinum]